MKKAAFALACLMLATDAAAAANRFGAIALSESTFAYGWAGDRATRREAERAALGHCYRNAGDCRIVVWVRNACMALATGDEGWGTGYSASKSQSMQTAMENCEGNSYRCQLRIKYCSR